MATQDYLDKETNICFQSDIYRESNSVVYSLARYARHVSYDVV